MQTTTTKKPLSTGDKIVGYLGIAACVGMGAWAIHQATDDSLQNEVFLQKVEQYHPSDTWSDIAGRTLTYDTDALKIEAGHNACRFIQDGADRDYYTQFQGIYDAALDAGFC